MEINGSALENVLNRLTLAVENLESLQSEPATVNYTLAKLLEIANAQQASLLHINTGTSPTMRIKNQLVPIGSEALSRADCNKLILPVLTDKQRSELYSGQEVELCYPLAETGFRLNIYMARGSLGASIRRIRSDIPTLEKIGLKDSPLAQAAEEEEGLVLLTGSARCGKLNTLASLLDHINSSRSARIISLEEPIQFWHSNKKSTVIQREIGIDTSSFSRAVQQAVLQDPDIIALSSIPDRETAEYVIRAAGGGHLVIAMLDAASPVRALERLIGTFTDEEERHLLGQLAANLRLVCGQTLVHRADERGFLPAFEILVATEEVRRAVASGDVSNLHWIMQQNGMLTLERSLSRLLEQKLINQEEALKYVSSPEVLNDTVGQSSMKEDTAAVSDSAPTDTSTRETDDPTDEGAVEDMPMMGWL